MFYQWIRNVIYGLISLKKLWLQPVNVILMESDWSVDLSLWNRTLAWRDEFWQAALNGQIFEWGLVGVARRGAARCGAVRRGGAAEQAGNIYLRHTQQHHSVNTSLSLSLCFSVTLKAERDSFSSQRETVDDTNNNNIDGNNNNDGQSNSINFICF